MRFLEHLYGPQRSERPALPAPPASGNSVQFVSFQTGAVATGSTQIPSDDTIPQNTEGDQYMQLTITPKSASNLLVIDTLAFLTLSGAGAARLIAALFQDAVANALKVNEIYVQVGSTGAVIPVSHIMLAGTTAPTTFKYRAGQNAAGTVTFNGNSSVRTYGGTMGSYMRIWEIAP